MNYKSEVIIKAGYILMCFVTREIRVAGMRIALAGELRCLKMLVKAENSDESDVELLRDLKEPHVKLAYELAEYLAAEFCVSIEDPGLTYEELMWADMMEDPGVQKIANELFCRFIFRRRHHRRRDRYTNFNEVLYTAQRALYEWCKLLVTGETRAGDMSYRTNYSSGRLRALTAGMDDVHLQIAVSFIEELEKALIKSLYLEVENHKK